MLQPLLKFMQCLPHHPRQRFPLSHLPYRQESPLETSLRDKMQKALRWKWVVLGAAHDRRRKPREHDLIYKTHRERVPLVLAFLSAAIGGTSILRCPWMDKSTQTDCIPFSPGGWQFLCVAMGQGLLVGHPWAELWQRLVIVLKMSGPLGQRPLKV